MNGQREQSKALPAYFYRDPAVAYERIEASTCQGCTFVLNNRLLGSLIQNCAKGKNFGVRCKQYREEGVPIMKAPKPTVDDDGYAWVEEYLRTWARYQRYPGLQLSAPSRAPGFLSDITGGYRDEEEPDIVGWDRALQIIEAVLSGCSEIERCVLNHKHLHAVWRFRESANVDEVYLRVRKKIGDKLKANAFTGKE